MVIGSVFCEVRPKGLYVSIQNASRKSPPLVTVNLVILCTLNLTTVAANALKCSVWGCDQGLTTRWFKYDWDDLCVNKSQFVPVIFEPPCICVASGWADCRESTGLSYVCDSLSADAVTDSVILSVAFTQCFNSTTRADVWIVSRIKFSFSSVNTDPEFLQ
jgi:hypothetical protein